MPRQITQPHFPDTPGKWLSWFSYRRRDEEGHRLSPEETGRLIGVSGATVRRWEADRAEPRIEDIANLTRSLGISLLENEFLHKALRPKDIEPPPEGQLFELQVAETLATPFPAYLMDSLFFIRAWNSYSVELERPPVVLRPHYHPLEWSMRPEAAELWSEARDRRTWRWLQDFWLSTAELCGTPAYQALVARLSDASPMFKERWLMLANGARGISQPLGASYDAEGPGGAFKIIPMRIVLPPTYNLRIYIPEDDEAEESLARLRKVAPPAVEFSTCRHWSLDKTLCD